MNDQMAKLANFPDTEPSLRAAQLVWYALSGMQTLLVLRFMLKLLGADATDGFTYIIYGVTDYVVYPFTFVFSPISSTVNVFEWTTLLAIVAYWVLAVALTKLLEHKRSPLLRIERARRLSIEKYTQLKTDGFLKRLYKKL